MIFAVEEFGLPQAAFQHETVAQRYAVAFEVSHPAFDNKAAHDPGLAVEFKYDREIPSEGSVNKTQRAGAAFHDLYRLTGITEKYIRVFIYVASPAMNEYFDI